MKRILIVDDSEFILTLVEDILVASGYEVAGKATSGQEAVLEARRLRPDLVLMDIIMPGEPDGIGAARLIRDELDIPVVFLTGHEDEKLIVGARDAGGDGYLLKPVKPAELKGTIEIALQKKESETELRNLYRRVVEETNDLIYVTDGQGNIKFANDQILKIGGFKSRDEIVGKSFVSFLAPEALARAAEIFRRQLKGEDVQPFELEMMDSAGTRLIIEIRERLVWKDGRVVEVHGIGRDVTERKRVEKSLRESEERYRALYEDNPSMYFTVDEAGTVLSVNPFGAEQLGYAVDELVGQSVLTVFFEADRVEVTGQLRACLENIGQVARWEFRKVHKNGGVMWVREAARAVERADGKRVVLIACEDITDHKQTEEALRKSEERYRIITENMQESVWVLDKDFKPIYVSPVAMRFRGYTFEEIQALPLKENMTPESFDKIVKVIIDLLNKKKAGHTESRISAALDLEWIRKDGTLFWVEVYLTLIFNEKGEFSEALGVGRDITERRRTEEALRKSEEKYRNIFNSSVEGIFQTTPRGQFISVNPAFAGMLGYESPEEIMAAVTDIGVQIYADPAERERMKGLLEKDGLVKNFETEFRRKDGEKIWVTFTASCVRDKEGTVLCYEGIAQDITKERKAREEILYLKEFNESIINSMIDSIDIMDEHYTILFQNHAAKNKFGEGVGKRCHEFYHGKGDPCDYCLIQKAIHEKKCYSREVLLEDGTYLEVHSSPIQMPDGTPCSMEIMRDITKRKRAERALRESEEKFRGVFETSRDFMYISSPDDKIIDYSASAKSFFGYTEEEIKNMTMLNLYYDQEDRAKLVEKLGAEGFVENYELKLKKKDGSLIYALATIVVRRDSDGSIIGYQGAVKDVTQMKQLEQYLLQAEKLSGLGTMISGVAHELNNPLTAIMGNAELLLMNKKIPAGTKKSLNLILTESERAAKIISGLLAFAREHKPGRSLVNINDIIMESYRLKDYNLRVSNVTVDLALSKNLPPTYADPNQLHQVFTNIINNAHDALAEKGGGTLTITSAEKNGSLIVMFKDDGPGIEEGNLKKIFDPFFTTKDVGKGTGLGLSMAYGIINEHGGNIEVESKPGKGARFTVTIPVIRVMLEKDMEADRRKPEIKPGHVVKRILVVDDEEHLRDMLSDALSRMGHIVEVSASGQEALGLIEQNVFDGIVADIKMPGMDGKELYGHVLNKYPNIAGKFLFVTGDILSEETQVFLKVSDCKYVAKPFRMNEFLAILNRILDS